MKRNAQNMQTLRKLALRYPEAQEGIACEGTTIERRTVKARNKAFVFLGLNDAMLKLHESLTEATHLASKEPSRYKVGAHGWVTVTFGNDESMLEVLKRWIDESYRLIVPKQLVALLPARGVPTEDSTETAGNKAKKKSTKNKAHLARRRRQVAEPSAEN